MLTRLCNLPPQLSFFLFGARQCGKTTLLEQTILKKDGQRYPGVWILNLLKPGVSERYLSNPRLFYGEVLKRKADHPELHTVIVDEIQRVPELLNSVQLLMTESSLRFVLTGSSARKLKRGGANLLGGRALERHLFPLTRQELGERFDLDDVLRFGSIPGILLDHTPEERTDLLNAYVSTYLREEIQQEAIVRNVPGFITFLEVAAQSSGELQNFAGVGRDANLHGRTVQTYYQILEDTLIGLRLPAYRRSVRRRLRVGSKFYLFDIGVLNALERQLRSDPDVVRRGKIFEHFIVLETHRLSRYLSGDAQLFYWRTRDDLEVDLIIENRGKVVAAVEIKSSNRVTAEYLAGLQAFGEEHPHVPRYVVAQVDEPFELKGVTVLPFENYLAEVVELLR